MSLAILNGQVADEILDYFSRDKMKGLVGTIKDMAINEASKFQYTKEVAGNFIPNISDAMNTIKEQEIEKLEEEQQQTN